MFKKLVLICLTLTSMMTFAASEQKIDELHQHVYSLINDYPDSAIALAEYTLSLSENRNYNWGVGNSYFIIGFINKKQNKMSDAFFFYSKAIDYLEKSSSPKAIKALSKIYSNCAIILNHYGQSKETFDFYDKSLALATLNNLNLQSASALYSRGSAFQESNSYENAIADLEECYGLATSLKNEFLIVNSLNMLGITHMYMNEYHKARDYFRQIEEHSFESLDPLEYIGRAYHNKARTFYLQDDYITAERGFQKAVEIKEKRGNEEEMFLSFSDLAETMAKNNKYEQSYVVARRAESYYEHVRLTKENILVFMTLRNICYQLNKYEEANSYSIRYEKESIKYLEEQQKIFSIKEQFTKDLINAGFYQPKSVPKDFPNSIFILLCLVIVLIIFVLITHYLWMRKKLEITNEIRAIEQESNV
jgi:hypothetical protein